MIKLCERNQTLKSQESLHSLGKLLLALTKSVIPQVFRMLPFQIPFVMFDFPYSSKVMDQI